ncbi:MAG TPA: PfkB family carbohydrate kinase [Solirubrobacterales bacterium]|nr:PfkB family carbohydrate kinase [Solirubrobacterales bacterium]
MRNPATPGPIVREAGDPRGAPSIPLRVCRLVVFDPSPALTVTVESGPDIHLHGGGQGFWVARMAARLGAEVRLCVPLGGETGQVLSPLLAAEGITVVPVWVEGANGAYVHDRTSGSRTVIAETASPPLLRHELDDLYGVTLTAGLDADLTLLTGPRNEGVLPDDTYGRLTADLGRNDGPVLADLSGEPMREAVRAGIDLIKASHEDLEAMGELRGEEIPDIVATARHLRESGARNVVISHREHAAVAILGERALSVSAPRFIPLDAHGAGDSLFAGLGVALGCGLEIEDALRIGMAAGALNVTRHGLGTGHAREISALAPQVRVEALGDVPSASKEAPASG